MIRRTVLPFCCFVLAVAAVFSAIVLLGRVNVDTVTGPPGQADMTGVDFAATTAETDSLLYTPGLFLQPGQLPPPRTAAHRIPPSAPTASASPSQTTSIFWASTPSNTPPGYT